MEVNDERTLTISENLAAWRGDNKTEGCATPPDPAAVLCSEAPRWRYSELVVLFAPVPPTRPSLVGLYSTQQYTFDRVYDQDTTQETIYTERQLT